jgi:penicillin-insensitive murein endopeptidase
MRRTLIAIAAGMSLSCAGAGVLPLAATSSDPLGDLDEAALTAPLPDEESAAEEPAELTDEQIAEAVAHDLPSLGSMSLGKPNGGALVNGVMFPEGERWEIIVPQRAYGTSESIAYLITAVDKVHAAFPETHKLSIGHLSKERGGPIYPHRSHQSGRDIDIGYYYLPEYAEWYRPATAHTLDRERSWALVRAFLVETDVEMIFIDTRVQRLLLEYALSIGEDPDWLADVFQARLPGNKKARARRAGAPDPIIRHTWGHATHMHVRFYNPRAQSLGIRAFDELVAHKIIKPRSYLVPYTAGAGDTLAGLAKKAGTSEAAIQQVNGIGSIETGTLIYVPMRGQVAEVAAFDVPPRRLPPEKSGGQRHIAASN